jgi:hypothetical protein
MMRSRRNDGRRRRGERRVMMASLLPLDGGFIGGISEGEKAAREREGGVSGCGEPLDAGAVVGD